MVGPPASGCRSQHTLVRDQCALLRVSAGESSSVAKRPSGRDGRRGRPPGACFELGGEREEEIVSAWRPDELNADRDAVAGLVQRKRDCRLTCDVPDTDECTETYGVIRDAGLGAKRVGQGRETREGWSDEHAVGGPGAQDPAGEGDQLLACLEVVEQRYGPAFKQPGAGSGLGRLGIDRAVV